MKRLKNIVFRACAKLALLIAPCIAQAPDSAGARRLDSLIAANTMRLEMRATLLTGPGAMFLHQLVDSATIVAVGERHGLREIPQLTLATAQDMRRGRGVDALATENGSVTTELLLAFAKRRNADSVMAFG